MENLTKENVFIRVDTKKKARKLKKVLDMFGEDVVKHILKWTKAFNYVYYNGESEEWGGAMTSFLDSTEVTIKQLKQILAKEKEPSRDLEVGKWASVVEQDKFAELKEAHKNGAVIQFKNSNTNYEWVGCLHNKPSWDIDNEYRIKPEEKPQIGDVCKFWDNNESFYTISKLHSLTNDDFTPYVVVPGFSEYKNAKKLTQQEVNDLLFKN